MRKRIYIFWAFAVLLSEYSSISKMRTSNNIKAEEKYLLEEDYEKQIKVLNRAIKLENENANKEITKTYRS